jgi:hypothetical protein
MDAVTVDPGRITRGICEGYERFSNGLMEAE